jgi:hypothetical protein
VTTKLAQDSILSRKDSAFITPIFAKTILDKYLFASMCTPTSQLTDLTKEVLTKEVGYGIVRIGDLSV